MHLPYQCGFKRRDAVNASLLLNLINNNFLIFLTENLPILNPYLPQNLKICDPILVNLLKMRPHYSHSSRENATPSSGTSPLASCKGVPPPPGSFPYAVLVAECGQGCEIRSVRDLVRNFRAILQWNTIFLTVCESF